MVERQANKKDKRLPGTSFQINLPFSFSVSATQTIHDEISSHFKEEKEICPTCKRLKEKINLGILLRKEICKRSKIKGLNELTKFPFFDLHIKNWKSQFWNNLPFQDIDLKIPVSDFVINFWEKYKKEKKI